MRPAMHTRCLLAATCLVSLCACTQHALVDTVMSSAYRPRAADMQRTRVNDGADRLLAGDLHCHLSPPDADWDVSRNLEQTIALAHAEHLDFVVLTPHVPALFFADAQALAYVRETQRALREAIARAHTGGLILIAGFEYTDHSYGHVGMAFADLEEVLADLDLATLDAHPERFVEAWVAHGGTLVVNHPLVTPVDSIVPMARADLSWRPWTSTEAPPEIRRIDALATGWEAYSLSATHLRDHYVLREDDATLEATLQRLDREIARRRGRMTPVGGSDSHSQHLRATTFVRVQERSARGVHDGLVAGQVCVRSPSACAFEARAAGGPWVSVGDAIEGAREFELRGPPGTTFFVGGRALAADAAGRVTVRSDRCTPLRAELGRSRSAPIYANCRLRTEATATPTHAAGPIVARLTKSLTRAARAATRHHAPPAP